MSRCAWWLVLRVRGLSRLVTENCDPDFVDSDLDSDGVFERGDGFGYYSCNDVLVKSRFPRTKVLKLASYSPALSSLNKEGRPVRVPSLSVSFCALPYVGAHIWGGQNGSAAMVQKYGGMKYRRWGRGGASSHLSSLVSSYLLDAEGLFCLLYGLYRELLQVFDNLCRRFLNFCE